MNNEESIQIKPMKYLVKISLLLLISCSPIRAKSQIRKEISENSILSCMQGIWKPINSQNTDLIEYVVYDSFNSFSISYTKEKLERIILTINGLYNLDRGYSLSDTLKVSELQSHGSHFVWFFAEDVKLNGWAQLGGVQSDLICDGDIIEMSDNGMSVLEKETFLPYTAYYYLQQYSKKENRDYVREFDILDKLKKAKVIADKTYFHNQKDASTRRKAFVLNGDQIIIDKISENWVKVAFEGSKTTTEGWLKRSDIEIID